MIEFGVAPSMTALGLSVTLGCICASVRVDDGSDELTRAMQEEETARVASLGGAKPAEVPEIAATRRAYRALGKDPARYRPSSEALMRRLVSGKGLYRINNAVDVINLVSVRSGFSIGGYDADKIRPPAQFRRAEAGETYEAIGRGAINLEGLPVFADAEGPFGSPTSDSARTMVSAQTTNLQMVIIAFETADGLDAAMTFAVDALTRYCSAQDIETVIV